MKFTDEPSEIREGEDLDKTTLREYLIENIKGLDGELEIKQYARGYSNLTYLIKAGEKEMILRRPPAGRKAKSAHDMGREYRMLSSLKPVFPYAPGPLLYCDDPSVIGAEFYVMERIKGIILRKDLPENLKLSSVDMGRLCRNMVDVWKQLHEIDYTKTGLAQYGKPEGYIKRQVEGWSKRYRDAKTPDAPEFEGVMEWLHDNMPGDTGKPAIIHNDYKFDNLVLDPDDPTEIRGVLDWEMSTTGDPLMDLGASMAYWVEKDDPEQMQLIRMLPTQIEGAYTREQIISYYSKISGRDTGSFDFFYCFGLFRLAVIAEQIYYRFYHGQTRDSRFKSLIFAVKVLEQRAVSVIEGSG
jgi:aminoglycoside phosphotransferase (APT) family kinase protein